MRIKGEIRLRENNRRALATEMLFLAFPKEEESAEADPT
jgi:hypothetical protein